MSRGARIFIIIAVDMLCVAGLFVIGFDVAMRAWGGDFVNHPRGGSHEVAIALGVIAVVLGLFAFVLANDGSSAGALSQVLLALIAAVVALSNLSSDSAAGGGGPVPVKPSPSAVAPSVSPTGRTFCYSGGTCYVNGTPNAGGG